MHTTDVVVAIEDGILDEGLQRIVEAIRFRREIVNMRKRRDMSPGDVVRFVNLGAGAKYLNGVRARIVEMNPKTVWVSILPEDRGRIAGTRFGRSSKIRVYPNNIELDHIDGQAQEVIEHRLESGPAPRQLKQLNELEAILKGMK